MAGFTSWNIPTDLGVGIQQGSEDFGNCSIAEHLPVELEARAP